MTRFAKSSLLSCLGDICQCDQCRPRIRISHELARPDSAAAPVPPETGCGGLRFRIEIRGDTTEPLQAQGKNEEFTAWVQYGDGAASENCTLEGDGADCGDVFP